MGTNGFDKDSNRASEAGKIGGKISKRKTYDKNIADLLNKYVNERLTKGDNRTRLEIMLAAAYKEFIKGNHKPWAFLNDRGFGKAEQHQETYLNVRNKSDEMLDTINELIGKPEKKKEE